MFQAQPTITIWALFLKVWHFKKLQALHNVMFKLNSDEITAVVTTLKLMHCVCYFDRLSEFFFAVFYIKTCAEFWEHILETAYENENSFVVCVTYSQYWVFITLEAADWRCVSALWRPGQRGTLAPGVFLWATGTAGQDSVCLDSATLQRSALSDCEETRLQLPETAIKTQCNTISRQFDDSFILD